VMGDLKGRIGKRLVPYTIREVANSSESIKQSALRV